MSNQVSSELSITPSSWGLHNFRPMLSGRLEEGTFSKLRISGQNPYVASPKLDGIRMLIHPDPKIGACSRSLKSIPNRALFKYIAALTRRFPRVLGLDGEITAGPIENVTHPKIFNQTTSAVMSFEGNPDTTQFTYIVFDKFYDSNIPTFNSCPYKIRYKHMTELVGQANFHVKDLGIPIHIYALPQIEVVDLEELADLETKYLVEGYEGLMLRHPETPYKFGRSSVTATKPHLLKLKRFEDAEATIIGFEELMHNENAITRDAFGLIERSSALANLHGGNTLGALIVRVTTGNYANTILRIGTGFNAVTRENIWRQPLGYLNRIVNFRYQAVGSINAPRFPAFRGFRLD